MDDILEALCRRFARRIRANGVLMLTHDGDPTLARAFTALGWGDTHPEVDAIVEPAAPAPSAPEAATVRDAERAVMPAAEGHQW